jgi:hypothetical protein
MKIVTLVGAFLLSIVVTSRAVAIDASQFEELEGYTVLRVTHASGEVEGADFDKLIKLDNGMIFEFHTYSYFYAYRPYVAIFSKEVVYQGKSVTLYKLLIGDEDEVFDVSRIR